MRVIKESVNYTWKEFDVGVYMLNLVITTYREV